MRCKVQAGHQSTGTKRVAACLKRLFGRTTWGGSMSTSILRRLRSNSVSALIGSSAVKVDDGLRK